MEQNKQQHSLQNQIKRARHLLRSKEIFDWLFDAVIQHEPAFCKKDARLPSPLRSSAGDFERYSYDYQRSKGFSYQKLTEMFDGERAELKLLLRNPVVRHQIAQDICADCYFARLSEMEANLANFIVSPECVVKNEKGVPTAILLKSELTRQN